MALLRNLLDDHSVVRSGFDWTLLGSRQNYHSGFAVGCGCGWNHPLQLVSGDFSHAFLISPVPIRKAAADDAIAHPGVRIYRVCAEGRDVSQHRSLVFFQRSARADFRREFWTVRMHYVDLKMAGGSEHEVADRLGAKRLSLLTI